MVCVRVQPDKFECHQVTKDQEHGGNPKNGYDVREVFPEWIQVHYTLEPVFSRDGEEQQGLIRHYFRTPMGDVPASQVVEGSWFIGDGKSIWHYSKERFEAAFKVVTKPIPV